VPAKLILEESNKPLTEVEPMDPNRPILTRLPNLKVIHSYDPDSGDTILTREDLVVVINSETKNSTFVQHADGTQMFSEIIETYPSLEHVMSQGEVMLDQVAEIYPKNPRNRPLTPPLGLMDSEGSGEGEGEGGKANVGGEKKRNLASQDKKRSFVEEEKRASLVGAEMDKKKQSIFRVPRTSKGPSLLHEPPPILPNITTTWHVHKEGLAKVQGKVRTYFLISLSKNIWIYIRFIGW
jgi:hypothetical protein